MSDDVEGDVEAADDTPAEQATLHGAPVEWSGSQQVLHPARHEWRQTALALLADGWNFCSDVTAVDYSAYEVDRPLPEGVDAERFEVVVSLLSHARRERLRVRIQVPDGDPTVDSLYAVHPGADFLEREVYDLFGITFTGHPDLSRILMPETWEGHPLRKDFAIGAIPVQFKAPNRSDRVVGHER